MSAESLTHGVPASDASEEIEQSQCRDDTVVLVLLTRRKVAERDEEAEELVD